MNPMIRRAVLAGSALAIAAAVSVPGASAATSAALSYTESEPATAAGQNDSASSAQRLYAFGTASWKNPAATVQGTLSPSPVAIAAGEEDNGAIPLATATGIGTDDRGAISTTGQLGDGPHGTLGDKTGDFDFYKLTGTAGHTLTVNTDGSLASTNTVVGVYNAAGELLASDDDSGAGLLSKLVYTVPATGDYYVVVAGKSPAGDFSADPNNSGSGHGSADTGTYQVLIAAAPLDKDLYAVQLAKGDVLGGSLAATGKRLTVLRPNGTQAVSSDLSVTAKLPASSPLPRGPVDFAYVAEAAGWYAVSVTDGFGPYDLTLGAFRSSTETAATEQTFFLDFDGGQIDTAPLGGTGVRQLSGLSAFLPNWGLTSADESAVINKVVAVVTENVKNDVKSKGLNPYVDVKFRNSRDDADSFGTANVSRVVVGGRTAESGLGRVGTAQSIDPGNFAHEETALVQLDRVSAASGAISVNTYLTANSDRIAFVGQALGNLVSREIGHLVGNYDTDQTNPVANLMDADGNFPGLYGVGADGFGGTADDVDVDFGKDSYAPATGLTGTQDTLNVAAWGLSKPCN
ncbi:pre-peptidase [Kribbella sp. VKM Ac-2527]|uniref:Pre-peptidase n=1 Tax=Kribbella caucasensis TaxID=2512215 RepID=A0A4R6KEC1_9ACTN|nr:PPC domain-containing protein [Kribbella sp. VKM Ac-2527]TDO46314.1 pre-peptidase [Kribbella sp. VKM Ac-2527]